MRGGGCGGVCKGEEHVYMCVVFMCLCVCVDCSREEAFGRRVQTRPEVVRALKSEIIFIPQ